MSVVDVNLLSFTISSQLYSVIKKAFEGGFSRRVVLMGKVEIKCD